MEQDFEKDKILVHNLFNSKLGKVSKINKV